MMLMSDDIRPNHAVKKPASLRFVVAVSLLVHVGIVALLSAHKKPLEPSAKPPAQAIKARIVYPTLPRPKEAINVMDSEHATSAEKSAPANAPTEQVSQEQNPQLIEATSEQPLVGLDEKPQSEPKQASTSTSATRTGSSLTRMRNHIGLMQQQQQHALAQQQSTQFQQQKQSPDLQIPEYQDTLPSPLVKDKIINCDRTAANVLRIVSQIAGGNLRCRDSTDFNRFIEERVDKK